MRILKIKEHHLFEKAGEAAKLIKSGGVIVCPTDTVYGLIGDAANKKAVEKIYQIKKRPKQKLIPVFVDSIKTAKKLVKISKKQEAFLKKVWPGPVTAVFDYKKPGIRMPNHQFILDLIKRTGPLAETSANISGEPATAKIKEVLKYFKGKRYQPDLILDAGDLKPAKPSQVIDLIGATPKVLRK